MSSAIFGMQTEIAGFQNEAVFRGQYALHLDHLLYQLNY